MHASSTDDGASARWPVWMGPPENEAPGALAVGAVLLRSDDAAVLLVGASVFTTGLELRLAVRVRRDPRDAEGAPVPLFELVDRHGGRRAPAPGRLLLGVELADGRVATHISVGREPRDGDARLEQRHSNGRDRSVDQEYWLTPVPPRGDLIVVCAWPAMGLTETRTVVPAAALVPAVAPQVLWPWEPEERPDPAPTRPDVDPGGWFERVLGAEG